jgi:hypothetical protein
MRRVLGVQARRNAAEHKETFFADLLVVADGCFSNFRSTVMDGGAFSKRPVVGGNFVGVAVLEGVTLPILQHGTVALVKGYGHGPVLLCQIGEHDTRVLIDIKNPFPADLKVSVRMQCIHCWIFNCTRFLYRTTFSPTSSHNCPHPCTQPSTRHYRKTGSGASPTRPSRPLNMEDHIRRKASSSSATHGTCTTRPQAVA